MKTNTVIFQIVMMAVTLTCAAAQIPSYQVEGEARSMFFTASDGANLILALDDGSVCAVNAETGAVNPLLAADKNVTAAAYDREAGTLFTLAVDASSGESVVREYGLSKDGKAAALKNSFSPGRAVTAFDSRGGKTITGSESGALTLREAGKPPLHFGGHGEKVALAKLSGDGAYVISAAADGEGRLWNMAGYLEGFVTDGEGSLNAVCFLTWDEKKYMACGREDGSLFLYNLDLSNSTPILKPAFRSRAAAANGKGVPILCMAVSGDGQYITAGCWDGKVRCFDMEQLAAGNDVPSVLGSYEAAVAAIAYHPEEQRYAVTAGQRLSVPAGPGGGMVKLTFPAGVYGTTSVTLKPAAAKTKNVEKSFYLSWYSSAAAERVMYNVPQGEYTVTVNNGLRCPADTVCKVVKGETTALTFEKIPEEKKQAAEKPVPLMITAAADHSLTPRRIAYSASGNFLAAAFGDRSMRIWFENNGAASTLIKNLPGVPNALAVSPSGAKIAAAFPSGAVAVYDAVSGKQLFAITAAHAGAVNAIAWSGDGKLIASGGADTELKLWDADSGRGRVTAGMKHNDGVSAIAFSPDGSRVLTVSGRGLRLWETASGAEIAVNTPPGTAAAAAVVYSPKNTLYPAGGRYIAVGYADGVTRLLDAATGKVLYDTEGSDEIRGLAFSNDGEGKYVVTAAGNAVQYRARVSGRADGKTITAAAAVNGIAYIGGNEERVAAAVGGTSGGAIIIYDESCRERAHLTAYSDGSWAFVRADAEKGSVYLAASAEGALRNGNVPLSAAELESHKTGKIVF